MSRPVDNWERPEPPPRVLAHGRSVLIDRIVNWIRNVANGADSCGYPVMREGRWATERLPVFARDHDAVDHMYLDHGGEG